MSTKRNVDEGPARDSAPLRRSSPTMVPCLSDSSISDYEERAVRRAPDTKTPPPTTLRRSVSSTLFKKRLSTRSSLAWGHRPSPLIGASCLLFLLPIPVLLRAGCPVSAFLLLCVTASSYASDHAYTGLDSWAHLADRVLAPMAFASNIYSIYSHFGLAWAISGSSLALQCHLWANYYAKKGMYDEFVVWHSLWHAVGVGSILVAFAVNGIPGRREGGLESIFSLTS